MTDSLFAALAERHLDAENDDPSEWTDEMMLARIDELIGEGWYQAGKAEERLKDLSDEYAAWVEGRFEGVIAE